jgi:Phage Mu protein F like protein
MPWKVEADPVQPQNAIDWFRARLPLTEASFKALEADARQRAFYVGGLTTLDIVQDTFSSLEKALTDGQTFQTWKAEIGAKLENAWGKPNAHRLKTVFDTNLQQAYGAGRYKSALESESPYWSLEIVLDGKTSIICQRLINITLPVGHPFWKTHIPPFHFRCRTALITLSSDQANARGITEKIPEVQALTGFGHIPGEHDFTPDPSKYDPRLWAARQKDISSFEQNTAIQQARDYGTNAVVDGTVFTGEYSDGIAAFNPKTKRIELNPEHSYWTDISKVLNNGYLSTNAREHLIRHEVAHARIFESSAEEFVTLTKMQWSDVVFETASDAAKLVSQAARVSPGEFVAEVFAGLENGLKYDADVMKLYELLHGGNL